MSLETIIEIDETISVLDEKEIPFLDTPRKNWWWLPLFKYVIIGILFIAFLAVMIAVFLRLYKSA
jgi:flagellar biosynthesis/type III secretory pathway M-ring protein FliF/YscJ